MTVFLQLNTLSTTLKIWRNRISLKSVFKRVTEIYPEIAERFLGAENEGDLEPADLSEEDIELFINTKFSPLRYVI